jgi:hypothetical protein
MISVWLRSRPATSPAMSTTSTVSMITSASTEVPWGLSRPGQRSGESDAAAKSGSLVAVASAAIAARSPSSEMRIRRATRT